MQFSDYLIDGKVTASLLEAPLITCVSHTKLRNSIYCQAKFCLKLSTQSATSLISVFGQYLDVHTHTVSAQGAYYLICLGGNVTINHCLKSTGDTIEVCFPT